MVGWLVRCKWLRRGEARVMRVMLVGGPRRSLSFSERFVQWLGWWLELVFSLDFKLLVVQFLELGDLRNPMRITLRWLGVVLVLGAVAFFIASGQLVNIPGPVETAKSNYIIVHGPLSIIISLVLALVGATVFAKNFKAKM